MNVVDKVYERRRFRGPDGRVVYSATANDAVSRALFGMTKAELVSVMNANDMGDRFHKHSLKNLGHFKMILGQALRDRVKKGQTLVIGPHVVRSLDQEVALPAGYEECPKRPESLLPPAVRITVKPHKHRRK